LFNIIPPKKPLIRLVLEGAFIHRAKAAVLMRFPPGTIVIHSQKYSGMDSLSTERRFSSAIRVGPARGGAARETDEQKAESIVAGELKRHGWKESELGLRPKADKVKIALAKRLRKETTNAEMDSRTPANGKLDICVQSAGGQSGLEATMKSVNSENRPLSYPFS